MNASFLRRATALLLLCTLHLGAQTPSAQMRTLLRQAEEEISTTQKRLAEEFSADWCRTQIAVGAGGDNPALKADVDTLVPRFTEVWGTVDAKGFTAEVDQIRKSLGNLDAGGDVSAEDVARLKAQVELWRTASGAWESLYRFLLLQGGKSLVGDDASRQRASQNVTTGLKALQTLTLKPKIDIFATPPQPPSELEAYVRALGSADLVVRKEAMLALIRSGTVAVPVLTKALRGENVELRRRVAAVLARIGPEAQGAAEALEVGLKDQKTAWDSAIALGSVKGLPAAQSLLDSAGDAGATAAARMGLATIGPSVCPLLDKALASDREDMRLLGLQALDSMGPAVAQAIPAIIRVLEDDSAAVRAAAASALGSVGAGNAAAATALVKALEDSSDKVRAAAAWALRSFPEAVASDDATQAFMVALDDAEATVRRQAIRTLGQCDVHPRQIVQRLVASTGDPDAGVRTAAIQALGKMGADARSAVPQLQHLFSDRDLGYEAFSALRAIADDPGQYVLPYLEASRSAGTVAQGLAMLALGQAGEQAQSAVPEMKTCFKSTESYLRICMLKALGDMGPSARSAQAEIEFNAEGTFRDLAPMDTIYLAIHIWGNYALARIKEDPTAEVNELIRLLADERKCISFYDAPHFSGKQGKTSVVGLEAVRALGRLGPAAKAAVPRLAELARGNSRDDVRYEAIAALGQMGPDAAEAVPVLAEALDTGFDEFSGCMALAEIGPKAAAAVPSLVRILETPYSGIRDKAEDALVSIGAPALTALTEAATHPNPYVAFHAGRALARIKQSAGQ